MEREAGREVSGAAVVVAAVQVDRVVDLVGDLGIAGSNGDSGCRAQSAVKEPGPRTRLFLFNGTMRRKCEPRKRSDGDCVFLFNMNVISGLERGEEWNPGHQRS